VEDALFRRETEEQALLATISAPTFMLFHELRVEIVGDAALRQLRTEVLVGSKGDRWCVIDDLITCNG
jgi:hypothetical protein